MKYTFTYEHTMLLSTLTISRLAADIVNRAEAETLHVELALVCERISCSDEIRQELIAAVTFLWERRASLHWRRASALALARHM